MDAQGELVPWPVPSMQPEAESLGVHVWRARLARDSSEICRLEHLLSEDERARAERFHFEEGRRRYIVARGVLRSLLSYYTGLHPRALRFTYGRYGKPSLWGGHALGPLHFNLSHSHEVALYALAPSPWVGADVEWMVDERFDEQAAEQVLSPREMAVLRAASSEEKPGVFYAFWTRKEAYGKALGKGLAPSLRELTLSLARHQSVTTSRAEVSKGARIRIEALEVGSHYAAAVAAEEGDVPLRCWHWPDEGDLSALPQSGA